MITQISILSTSYLNSPAMRNQIHAPSDPPKCSLDEDEGYHVYLDDASIVSSLTCSVIDHPSLKRSHKAMDLSSIYNSEDVHVCKKRRRGASYTILEIRSLLHLMKRVLPKTPDEWKLIRLVHCRIFPDNDRTVQSLKKKFKDLCRDKNVGPDLLDQRFRAPAVHGVEEVQKAREVQDLISQKPSGFQLVLSDESGLKADPNSIPYFKVKVPNPLEPTITKHLPCQVPEFVQIPESPIILTTKTLRDEDEMSDLDLDIDGFDKPSEDKESVLLCPIVAPEMVSIGIIAAPCCGTPSGNKLPVVITDQK